MVDIIGALPKRDEKDYGKGSEAFDIILSTAKRLNKMVHVHVDQFNESLEYETEELCAKTIEHGMQAKLWPFTVFPSQLTPECIAAACTI